MEDSYHSSMCKAAPSKEIKASGGCSEESGWTTYFEDFSNNNINNNDDDDDDDQQNLSFSLESPSLVSDAATNGAWRNISYNKHVNVPQGCSIRGDSSPNYKSPIRLTFNKTTSRQIYVDDSLEDTASSPVNSPKIADLRPVGRSYLRKADYNNIDNYQEKTGGNISEVQQEKTSMVDFNGKSDCIDLKNRGLCLVPMSMLVKYIG